MGREEQIEEREVLESIFPEEITEISETEYRIKIDLDIPDDEPTEEPPVMLLHVRYTDAYPDEAPFLDIQSPQNYTSTHPYFSLSEDKEHLVSVLEETVQENLGMAMVFTLVTAVKDAAEQLVADRKLEKVKEREEVARAAEREENKKFHGTPVNPETFMKWRNDFMKEMEDAKIKAEEERLADLKKARVKEPVKLTGRQLWEGGLVGKLDAVEGDEEDEVTEGVEKLKVEAAS
ncbi:RWD domain-containing protein [Plectosphaerella cucumerina]|uniref:RWD domain-containing protein n=1 Tax=Plectosphaerella cucumerina TaxID=40658 RepID=A0A8K0X8J7_9PEZI|nr:RWD domain-containing protein [Plectosphaerella cucumerina]